MIIKLAASQSHQTVSNFNSRASMVLSSCTSPFNISHLHGSRLAFLHRAPPPHSLASSSLKLYSASNFGNANLRIRLKQVADPDFLPMASRKFTIRASAEQVSQVSSNRRVIIIGYAITVTLAVANRVLYKLALVPMKHYPFFLAQFTTFGYVAIYFSVLYIRRRIGIVTDEMLALPKSRFVAIGILEAIGVATGMSAGAMLPGPAIPILSQTFLVWQLTLSAVLLGRKYSFNQILGCLLVAVGVVIAVSSGSNSTQLLSRTEFFWPAVMIASSAFQAGASIIKELIFVDAAKQLKGKSVDIFVVNSYGSGFQALFVFLLLPILSNLKGIPFTELPSYLRDGAGCFLNIGANTTGCDGAPWLPLMYIATNMAFNVSVLNLVKRSSAVVASLAVMLSVPVSIYVMSLPLPYLPEGSSLSPFFVAGTTVLLLGLAMYNLVPKPSQPISKTD